MLTLLTHNTPFYHKRLLLRCHR